MTSINELVNAIKSNMILFIFVVISVEEEQSCLICRIMKFLIFFVILFYSITSAQAQETTESSDKSVSIYCDLINDWTRAKAFTKSYLDAMPEEYYGFKPTPEISSFAQEYLHLACVNVRYASMIDGTSDPCPYKNENEYKSDPERQSKQAVTEIVMQSYDDMLRAISEMDNKDEITTYYGWYCTKECIARKGFEHQTHHRGKTAIYLRLKGITPPVEMLIRDWTIPKDVMDE